MRLEKLLKQEYFNDDLQAKNKTDALAELSELVMQGFYKLNQSQIYDVLLQREKLGSTGIGGGVAISHGKTCGLDELIIAFARSKNGVAFDSIDCKLVHLFFILLVPENSTGLHLKVLARISKMTKASNFRKNSWKQNQVMNFTK